MYVITLQRLYLVCHVIYIPLNVFDEYLSQRHCNSINPTPHPLTAYVASLIQGFLICFKSKTPCFYVGISTAIFEMTVGIYEYKMKSL